MANMELIKELREKTGAGVSYCKEALENCDNDIEKAIEYLRKKGLAQAEKKIGKEARQGIIHSYIHLGGKIGVMLELNCETDFVARTEDFKKLANELCLQIAFDSPKYISREEIPEDILNKEKDIIKEQLKDMDKPPQVIEKIIEGKMEDFYKKVCLIDLPYIRDDKIKVDDIIKNYIAKLGENIVVRRFVRFEVGEKWYMNYKRILIKISGESLSKEKSSEYDLDFIMDICLQIKKIKEMGIEISIVIGGGNFWRGAEGEKIGVDRATSDYIGMIATIMNALFIQSILEKLGLETRVQSALNLSEVCEPYIRRKAIRHLEKGRIVIFASGTGNPYFTTDTAATLRASEINAEVVLKGTNVDGVYSEDPKINKDAKLLKSITYTDFLIKNLKALDPTAISLSRETNIPVIVFNIKNEDSIIKALKHEQGTIIKGG